MVAVTAFLCVLARDVLPPAVGGLAVVYALSLGGVMQYTMRLATETETSFTSVERLQFYSRELPYEAEAGTLTEAEAAATPAGSAPLVAAPAASAPASSAVLELCHRSWLPESFNQTLRARGWPARGRGELRFAAVGVRYREELPLALRGVSFRVRAGHSVGVVGRTGSVKSTRGLALLRVLELAEGRIELDGVDVARVGLHQLRAGVAVIPQDPTLFRGDIRSNLDLFGEHGDEAIWAALEASGLAAFVRGLEGGLGAEVVEAGANLSTGQRQLVCLARAFLRGASVVLLDEATSSLDAQSDAQVQRALRAHARGCTLIVVAHRLDTVIDSDRILVLDGGEVAEFDSPAALLGLAPREEEERAGPGRGAFAALVDATGAATATELHAAAKAASDAAAAAAKAAPAE